MIRRGLQFNGKRTSTKLEPEFWAYLDAIARWRGVSVTHVVNCIIAEKTGSDSRASTLRVYCLEHARRHAAQRVPLQPAGLLVEWVVPEPTLSARPDPS